MGAFKEMYNENFDEVYFQNLEINLESLTVELDVLDQQLEFIDFECAQIVKEVELLLPSN